LPFVTGKIMCAFFISSRRRHTRSKRDWSSDVCSSDLLSMELLRDINKDTIDFAENYDGSEKEPVVFPARFPNLLMNGSSGIAVGMATNIPPHQLGETIDAVLAVSNDPDITTDELME